MSANAKLHIEDWLRKLLVAFRFVSVLAAFTVFTSMPAHAWTYYSGASVGSDGTVYGWGVTDVTAGGMYHMAYVSSTLTSPQGRQAWGNGSAQNSVRDNMSLPFLSTDTGTYLVSSVSSGFCYVCMCWILYNAPSQATANNQLPTSLKVLTVQTLSLVQVPPCTSSDYGIFIGIHYQVLDQAGNPLPSGAMTPQEKDLNYVYDGVPQGDPEPNWHDVAPNMGQSTSTTDSNGQFWDEAFGTCSSAAFYSTFTQPIQMLVGTTGYLVRTNQWGVASTTANHGSVTNNVDISASN